MHTERWLERARAHRATHADPRVRELFESARIEPDPTVVHRWNSSAGEVTSYAVTVRVTARAMALVACSHAVKDTVLAVLSAAVSEDAGCSLGSFALRWSRVAMPAHGYRELPSRELDCDDEDELARELALFVQAMGEDEALLKNTAVLFDGSELVIEGVHRTNVARVKALLEALVDSVRVVGER